MIKTLHLCITSLFLMAIATNGLSQISPPFSDDFEGANMGWTVDSVSGSTWELGIPTTTPLNSTHSGVNAWDVDLFNAYLGGTECYLKSPVFDFNSPSSFNSTMTFWQNRSTEVGWDGVRVDYSTNGGASWNVLGAVGSIGSVNWYNAGGLGSSGLSGWDGNSNGWVQSFFSLNIFNGFPAVQFRFAFTSDPGTGLPGFTMDDFAILTPALNDAGVTAILDPNSSSQANSSSPVNVIIKNFGQNILNFIPVTYQVNGLIAGTFNYTDTLVPGASDTFNLGIMTVPSGTYLICAWTELASDGDGSNDTLCNVLTSVPSGLSVAILDSLGFVSCINPPVNDQVYVFGTAQLNDGDTVNINLSFGDGTDTTFITTVSSGNFGAVVFHSYLFSGQFSMQAIASSNTGLSDTIISYNQLLIGDTCGNITGKVYADVNSNCIFDGTDFVLSGIPVMLMQGANVISTYYSTSAGDYYFIVPAATTYDVAIDTSYAFMGITAYCPPSGKITGLTEPSAGNDFGFVPAPGFDLQPFMNGFIIRANAMSPLNISLRNNYFIPAAGDLKLILDTAMLQFLSSIPPVSQTIGDTLIWNVASVGNNYNAGVFSVSLNVIPNTTLVIGDTICFTVIGSPVTGDAVPGNNVYNACGVVTNSYDPNNKTVDPAGAGAGGNMNPQTDPLTYTVNFQNTGTAPAFNLFILDTIDTDLDISSLRVLNSSHFMSTTVAAPDVIKFSFNNIFLPDSSSDEPGSHGFVTYSISPKPGLPDGTPITNTGYIYFDFNPAIVTNTTTNTIDYTLDVNEIASANQLILYPNPATDEINILLRDNMQGELVITDISGRQMLLQKVQQRIERLSLKGLSEGIYFVTLRTDDSQITRKVQVVR